ncbi:MAG: hypothetical protein U0075_10660 [Thermomicrobiales bacterium]
MHCAHDTDVSNSLAHPSGTRRRLVMAALVAMVLGGEAPHATQAGKKKKKKKQKQKQERNLSYKLWEGSWTTRLSNGVTGVATFFEMDAFSGEVPGTYSNSVGSGVFACDFGGKEGASLRCEYEQDSDGTSGGFSISLTSKDRWFGSYFTNTGDSGTWEGVRR